jgi:hypothetical protein
MAEVLNSEPLLYESYKTRRIAEMVAIVNEVTPSEKSPI